MGAPVLISDHVIWTTPAFAAGNFTGNGSMTWTVAAGDVATFAYAIVGKMMTVAFSIITTTVGGTPDTLLQILIPGGKTSTKAMYSAIGQMLDNNVATTGRINVEAGDTKIYIQRTDLAAFTASTNLTYVRGQITFEIN